MTTRNNTSNSNNAGGTNKNTMGSTRNYVSGDSARSSSSHQFHTNDQNESSQKKTQNKSSNASNK
jgi:hypothetical protein